MAPNHLLALVAMVAMEPPGGFDPATIRSKKADVFSAMRPVKAEQVVRGQYGPGAVLGKPAQGYRNEPNVARDFKVETYVAMQLEIDNWRWAGVPFFIRTGKHLLRRKTEVAIRFKQAPYTPFRNTPVTCLPDNWLIICIAPDEGISLQFAVKRPGEAVDLADVRMDFSYKDWFPPEPNVGYETLLYDVMIGDSCCSCAGIWWRRRGAWCSRCSTPGAPAMGKYPSMRRAAKGRLRRTVCLLAPGTALGVRLKRSESGSHERSGAALGCRGHGRGRLRQIDCGGAARRDAWI